MCDDWKGAKETGNYENMKVEELDVGDSVSSEYVLLVTVECKDKKMD